MPLLLHSLDVSCCYTPRYEPRDYYMYRISDSYLNTKYPTPQFNLGSEENCFLWQSQTSKSIPLNDIYTVVYTSPVGEILDVLTHGRKAGDENKFKRWLRHDKEAAEFLLLAKRCEAAREEFNSPWYYPSKNCPVKKRLEEIVKAFEDYRGSRFKGRYLLQAERALFSLGRYEDCIKLWDSHSNGVGKNIIRDLTLRYVAGAWEKLGEKEIAEKYYGEAGDIESIAYIYGMDGIDWMSAVYERAPDSPVLREKLESILIDAENTLEWSHLVTSQVDIDSGFLQSVRNLCMRIGREKRVKDPDLWFYSAAFISHILGDNPSASRVLTLAENSPGSKYIKESIRVFRFYLDSMNTPDGSYETRMLSHVKWLEQRINDKIDEFRDITVDDGVYAISGNRSFFYWNDMLRKIVHSGIVPTLLKDHKETAALGFANMADNYLLQKVNSVKTHSWATEKWISKVVSLDDYRKGNDFNYHDYRDSFFELIDTVDVDCLIKYVKSMDHPVSGTMKYLHRRGYTERAFFNEVIGTRMIRLMRYEEAQEWLGKVPSSFQNRTNVYRDGYLKYDPFNPEMELLSDRGDYKFRFAHEMASLENAIKVTWDPDRKALMMTKFAIGMKNSVGNCWALSFYSFSGRESKEFFRYYNPDNLIQRTQMTVFQKAESLFQEALAICDNEETAARINHMLGNNATIMKKYANTQIASIVRGSCDTYTDYHLERKEHFWRYQMGNGSQ